MTYVFDLDGTLCHTKDRDYANAKPWPSRIKAVNRLYREGHTILIDSARGSATGDDCQLLTERQLDKWGVQYHRVRTGIKFAGDVYVDDKGVSDQEFTW
jgi:histidinol phosphatase-like enzyme